MVYKLKKMLPAAVMALTLIAVSNTAMAATVALSVNEITSFSMSAVSGNVTLSNFTFSNATAANETNGTGSVDPLDASAACVGTACTSWENQFYSHTPAASTEFSYGDAQISDSNILAGSGIASSIGELLVIDGIGYASGSNVLMSFAVDVTNGPTKLNFSFNSNALLETSGLGGAANMFFNITLTDSSSNTVFTWSPDELNHGISSNETYGFTGLLSAQTNELITDNYSLNIKMENQVNATVVPVPAAVWLFGTGLLGLVGVARRRV